MSPDSQPHPCDLFFLPERSDWARMLPATGMALAPVALLALLLVVSNTDAVRANQPARAGQLNIAWHYGAKPPLDTLKLFDVVVVEPGHGHDPAAHRSKSTGRSELFAYVSIGEIDPERAYAGRVPAEMLAGRNNTWNSRIVDQSHPHWPAFFTEQIIRPLWTDGYRGFFLDTMDSYHAIARTAAERKRQADGLVRTIRLMKTKFPQARLISNRGFELLSELKGDLEGVAAESLYGRWNQEARQYTDVPAQDRVWLSGQLEKVRTMGLNAFAIDYAPPGDRDKARDLARQILSDGFTPYVTNGSITQVGVGAIEIVPRKVLMIHNGAVDGEEHYSSAQRLAKMPLHYLGYQVELVDIESKNLPGGTLAGEYAAIVGIYEKDVDKRAEALEKLYRTALSEKIPLVLLNSFGLNSDAPFIQQLGLKTLENPPKQPIKAELHDAKIAGYEIEPIPDPHELFISAPAGSRPILGSRDADGQTAVNTAITPWGGYSLTPFAYIGLSGSSGERWLIDPIEFYRAAIERGNPLPRPDVTTETGRRMLMVHIDGDGFASRAEIPGTPFASEVMYRDFIRRYPVPHTVSIIEGEVAPTGLYPELSPTLEKIARNIFKLDHVEIASHSYSHPFFWRTALQNEQNGVKPVKKPHPAIKNYDFRLNRDISGSASYIDRYLAPPGKKTSVFLWTGDCVPTSEAIAETVSAGLLNMNGGDTTINRSEPTLTLVAPLSLSKNGHLQVFAPNQNENVYTNDWTGPFYGFDKVIETFQMTESPRRLKPINIYYHTYSASKSSAIKSLHRVYRYALKQPVTPVYGSEYIRKVIDFEAFALARDLRESRPGHTRWVYGGNGDLQTVRLEPDAVKRIDWAMSPGVSGRAPGPEGDYLHLNGPTGSFTVAPGPSVRSVPIIRNANGRISKLHRDPDGFSFHFSGHVNGMIEIEHPTGCVASAGKYRLKARRGKPAGQRNVLHSYKINKKAAQRGLTIRLSCPA